MPHVSVKAYKGKNDEQKRELAAAITQSLMAIFKSNEESISVSIEDFEPSEWPTKVYQPEILEKAQLLFKKPGYNPFK